MGTTVNALDTVWVLLAAMLVFFMQPGFALVEAGFTRSKNTANILMKNFVDFMFGTVLFWFVGFGIMFGTDVLGGFMGMPNLFAIGFDGNFPSNIPIIKATAATIPHIGIDTLLAKFILILNLLF